MKRISAAITVLVIALNPGHGLAQHDAHEHGHEHEEREHHGDTEVIQLATSILTEFGIRVEAAESGFLDLYTVLTGEIQVNQDQQAHIVPRYSGLVLEVKKAIGDEVKQGDVLAVLESNESLTPYALKSLIQGTVIEKHITLGESLKEDDVVFTVANLSTVWVDLTVYQNDLTVVKLGQKVMIEGGPHFPPAHSQVSYVSPTLDKHTRTGHARVVLPNPAGVWKPGLFVTGRVAVDRVNADILVPATAIQMIESRSAVFVETGEGFVPRYVEIGKRNKEHVEILSGLQKDERYVSHGGFLLKAEMAREELEHAGHAH